MTLINELNMLSPLMKYLFLGIFSLVVGSLLNLIIYRVPLMLSAEWRKDCCNLLDIPEPNQPTINLFLPRSFCPSCKATIAFWQNIPVLSYCLLLGRCRHCHTRISLQYPFVELLSMGLSLFAAWHFGFNLTLFYVLPFIWMLLTLCFIDLKHQILPDSITLSLLWLGLIANTQGLFTTLPDAVWSAAGAYLALWLFIQLFYLVTGKVGMGNGDFKLFAAFGAWFGWAMLPIILILSSLSGAIIGFLYLKRNKKSTETPVPFGPFLCVAGLIALFYGKGIMSWYLQ